MKRVAFILPNKDFEVERFERVLDIIKYRWKSCEIIYFAFNVEYYKKNSIVDKINRLTFNHLDKINLNKLENEYGEIDIFVLLRDKNETNPPFTWDGSIEKDFYRDFMKGYAGLRLVINKNNEKDFLFANDNFFTKTAHLSDGFVYLPFGFTYIRNSFGDINDLGFRILDEDIEGLKKRDKNHKLIAVFGGSAAFGLYSILPKTYIKILENKLNKLSNGNRYSVLNFAIPGHVVMNEMLTYLFFVYDLKPDLVIAHDGFNDLTCGQSGDIRLQKDFDIIYHDRMEDFAKLIHLGYSEEGVQRKPITNPLITIKAFYNRKKQFEKIANENGAVFISALQPMIYSKKRQSKVEKEFLRLNFQAHLDLLFKNVVTMYERYEIFEKKHDGFKYNINFHNHFKQYDENFTLFGDEMHQIDEGERIIAEIYFNYIKTNLIDKGIL